MKIVNDPLFIAGVGVYVFVGIADYVWTKNFKCHGAYPTVKDVDETRSETMSSIVPVFGGLLYSVTWPFSKLACSVCEGAVYLVKNGMGGMEKKNQQSDKCPGGCSICRRK
jgi:hypothetical protein